MNTKKSSVSVWVIRVFLIIMAVISIFPLVFAILTSFKNNQEFYANIWALPEKLRVENYANAFIAGKVGEYALNSIFIAVVSLSVTIVFAVMAAYALARLKIKGAELILVMLILIQVLPTESLIIPEYMIVSRLGLLNVKYAAMILPYIGWMLPGTIIILSNFFKTIPMELIESARIDGATEMTTMRKIIVPLMKAPVATCLVFDFCFVWGELMWAQLTTLSRTDGLPLSIGLLNFKGMYSTEWGQMTAAICMVIVPMYILFIFTQKYFIAGLTAGGVKG